MRAPNLAVILDELQQQLAELYGRRLLQLVLFGSQARDDAEPGSDIDVLLVLKGPLELGTEIQRTSDITLNMSLKYNEIVGMIFMEEEKYIDYKSPLMINIIREGILLESAISGFI